MYSDTQPTRTPHTNQQQLARPYETARHVHNPVYSDTQPTRIPHTNQQQPAKPREGKKIEHAYEVIPPVTSATNQHSSKEKGNTAGQVKTHNTSKLLSTF